MIRILQQDNRVTKAIFAVVIGAAIVTMVITLVPGIFNDGTTSSDPANYATVRRPGIWGKIAGDSVAIKTEDVQRQAEQQMQQQNLPPFYLQFVMSRAGQIQVERAVLQQEADHLGLQVSDEDLKSFLKSGPYSQYLFPGGTFVGEDQYINFVETYFHLAIADFEAQVKSDLEIQRLQALVTGGVTVSDAEVKAQYLKTGTKVKFDYATISASSLGQTINPSDLDLEMFFKQNAARYAQAVPEQRKISFFSFDANNLPNGGVQPVGDGEVQAYYAAHQDQYKQPEQVKTRHILISVAKGADAKTDAAAKAKAEDLLKQIKGGANFADLAKKNSDDPGSKEQGGDLPMIPTSSLDPSYAKAAMALNPGQTSDVVRSQFGYHIIQTEQKQVASVKSLAEVRPSIVEQLQAQKSGAASQAFGAQLVAQAKKDGMQKTADAHSLHLQTTDFLGKAGVIPSLPDSAALLSAAFSAAKGAAPQVVSTGEGYAVFVVDDVQAAHAPNFADYKSHILDDYRQQKTPELLNAQLIKLSDRAKALGDLHKAAAEMKIDVKSSDLVGRDAQVTDIGSMGGAASVAFNLPKGGVSGPINEGANGAVLQLTDKQEPTADHIAKNFAATKDKLLDQKRQEAFSVFIGSLMDRYEKAGSIAYTKKPTSPLGS